MLQFSKVASGRLDIPSNLMFSEGFRLGPNLFCLAPCIGEAQPLVYIKKNENDEFEICRFDLPPLVTTHVRNHAAIESTGKTFHFFADHGFDGPPFPGGPLTLLVTAGDQVLSQMQFPEFCGFFFDLVAIRDVSGGIVLLTSDLQAPGLRAFHITDDCRIEEFAVKLPKPIRAHGGVLSMGVRADGSILIGAGKALNCSLVCEYKKGELQLLHALPSRRPAAGETNFVHSSSELIWTLSHNLQIDETQMQVFSYGEELEPPDSVCELQIEKGLWFHRTLPINLPQHNRGTCFALNIRRTQDSPMPLEKPKTLFLKKEEGALKAVSSKGFGGDKLWMLYETDDSGDVMTCVDCHGDWVKYQVASQA
ncbi:MAG: hypothetical protein HRT45_03705 [Bdellovibrionales bacterium]|nr:hypothetical protein [Bdellovibrionales bacterium]